MLPTRALDPRAVVQQNPYPPGGPPVLAHVGHCEGGHRARRHWEAQAGLEVSPVKALQGGALKVAKFAHVAGIEFLGKGKRNEYFLLNYILGVNRL